MINLLGEIVISVVFGCVLLVFLFWALCETIDAFKEFYDYVKPIIQTIILDAIDLYYELKLRIKGK